jgi:hypothetical protein
MRRVSWTGLLCTIFCGVLPAFAADGPAKTSPERVTIPVRFFLVSDDDGKHRAAADVRELRRQVEFMSRAFEPAHVRFTFDPAHDLTSLKSTIINHMMGTSDANWLKAKREGNRIAAGSHGKLVVFLRYGPGAQPTGVSFSWFDYNFIAFSTSAHDYWKLAHEAAHYFGLAHPHGGPEFKTVKEAEAYFVEHEGRLECFDGDGLDDTPPCPGIVSLYLSNDRSVTLAGHEFTILRGNVVSYYHHAKPEDDLAAGTMTPQQSKRLRWFVDMRMKHGMALPVNSTMNNAIDAVSLHILKSADCSAEPQPVDQFLKGAWSGQRQLWCKCEENGQLTLELKVARSGRQRIIAGLTHAPDYGKLQFAIDGHALSSAFDAYGPSVLPSGPIELGSLDLGAGVHEFSIKVVGKKPQSKGYSFGLDCLKLLGE